MSCGGFYFEIMRDQNSCCCPCMMSRQGLVPSYFVHRATGVVLDDSSKHTTIRGLKHPCAARCSSVTYRLSGSPLTVQLP